MIADLKPYAAYKEAGLPWLGDIPAHWTSERAKWLFTKMDRPVRDDDEVVTCFRDGVVTLRKNRRLGGFTEATVYSGYQGIRKGDLVIHGMDAFAGAIGVSDSDGKATPVYNVCQPRPGVSASYYAHLVRQMSQSQWILALAKGIRERSTDFRFEMFGNQRVPLPPPDEQAAIVRILNWASGRLERTIRTKRKVIALINEQKQAIILHAVTRGIDSSVPLKPSGAPWLGDIPQHWEAVRSRRLFSARKEFALRDDVQLSATQAFGVIPQEEFERRVGRRVVKIFMHLEKRKHVERNDFVMSMRSFQGGLERAWSAGAIRSSYVVFKHSDSVDVDFFAYVFKSVGYIGALQATANFIRDGQDLTEKNFRQVDLPLLPIEEQARIAAYIGEATASLVQDADRLRREIDLLREFQVRLVADVVTGKLDVRETVAQLPDDAPLKLGEDIAELSDETEAVNEEAIGS